MESKICFRLKNFLRFTQFEYGICTMYSAYMSITVLVNFLSTIVATHTTTHDMQYAFKLSHDKPIQNDINSQP